jgi:hypothetical protein
MTRDESKLGQISLGDVGMAGDGTLKVAVKVCLSELANRYASMGYQDAEARVRDLLMAFGDVVRLDAPEEGA